MLKYEKMYTVGMIFKGPKSHIHNIARGLLIKDGEVILSQVKDAKWYFLPGGHIEDGETARESLLRELKEEIGEASYKITDFVGVCENIFALDEQTSQHELNLVFKIDVPSSFDVQSKEDDLEFVSVPKDALKDYKILPATLKQGLLEWLDTNVPFFKEI